jgi:chemotaxis protein methyltransferase CheR
MSSLPVGETSFFRHPVQFEHLFKKTLPNLFAKQKRVKIWSAGCSNGAEPLTILLGLNYYLPQHVQASDNCHILASDSNPQALETALLGEYSDWCIRDCPELFRQNYFKRVGENWLIEPALVKQVEYFNHDLLSQSFPSRSDIIFCRNVLIYFEQAQLEETLEKLAAALAPGGVLYLGYAEAVAATRIPTLEMLDPAIAAFRKKSPEPTSLPKIANDPITSTLLVVAPLPQPDLQPERQKPIYSSEQRALQLLRQAEEYTETDQADLALDSLRQSVLLDPSLGVCHYRVGLLELSLGNPAAANYHWTEVLRLAALKKGSSPVEGWTNCNWEQLQSWTERKLSNLNAIQS